jgi:16S rRNA (cytidine1402-2'-O)-methyltransferase
VTAGSLVLVATPIGNLGDLPPRAVDALRDADIVCCEDTRHSRKLLDHFGISPRRLLAVHEHNEAEAAARLVDEMVRDGTRVAFITDAGTPGISDPGERLVAAALDAGVDVSVVPGPAALIAALVVSGLPTDRFWFEGFLPRTGRERAERLAALAAEDRTVVLYEAPHRLPQTVRDLAGACGGERRIAIARELTKKFEDVWRGTLADAVERSASMEARGEHVLVVEGAPAIAAPSEDDLDAAVQRRLDAGLSTRDAAADVAAALGVPKRLAYNAAVRLSR